VRPTSSNALRISSRSAAVAAPDMVAIDVYKVSG
jgi:hypothetical protein